MRELARLHALYRAAVGSAPIGIGIADDAGEMLIWNDAMLAISGFAPSEVERWKEQRASDGARASRQRWIAVVRERGRLVEQPMSIPRPDGSMADAVVSVEPLSIGDERFLHITMRDVTELKRVEQALRESELRFRQVAETLTQVFYLTSLDHGEILYISPAYERTWGRTRQSLYENPLSWIEAIHPEDRAQVRETVMRGAVNGQYVVEYRIVRPDGSVRSIRDRAFELADASGVPYRLVGVVDDITDHKRLEEHLREAQKMEAIGRLAGGVAHDFNNLLTVILANVALLRRRLPAEDVNRQSLEDVALGAHRAAELTRKLLSFSRRAVLTLGPVDLRATVRETVALLRSTLDPRVKLVLDVPDELGSVLADAGEMTQVVLNLCLNACDAMPEGGTLLIRVHTCVLSEEKVRGDPDARPGESICVTVDDTGGGIPADVRPRIFEPFFTTKALGEGTGLGLAMVFGIVKQHHGWLEVTSSDQGTRFCVYLPLYTGAEEVSRESAPIPRTELRETILFVDDEAPLRRVADTILSDCGYCVMLAEDGIEALAILEREGGMIDLVVLDLRMPRMSGRDTLSAIERLYPRVRVLVSSGHADEPDRIGESASVAGSLPKPYGLDQLARAVAAALAAPLGSPVV